jgi:CHAT domain-containing protein
LGLLAPGRYKRLVFVGSGPIMEMPLAAMIDHTGKRLIENYKISYAFSLSSFFYQPNVVKPTRTLFCVADPTGPPNQAKFVTEKPAVNINGRSAFRGGFLPLPGARTEGAAVAALFVGSELLIGPEAREQKVTDEMKEFQILHFATHGFLAPNSAQSSGLVLAEEPAGTGSGTGTVTGAGGVGGYDGLLTVRKIVSLSAAWKRSMAAQLTVLSACETGRGVSQAGEGLMGLAWAFRAAGCPSIVVSQWSVDDVATKEWMVTFYGALKADKPKDDAVQAAMLEVKKTHPSPFYWAAFELIGDAAPLTLREGVGSRK